MRIALLVIWVVLLISCDSNPEKDSQDLQEVSILNPSFTSSIGVYFLENKPLVQEDIEKESKNLLPQFKKIDNPNLPEKPVDCFYMGYLDELKGIFLPPDTNYLKRMGREITLDEATLLQNCNMMFVATFWGSKENVLNKQKNIALMFDRLVQNKSVILVDFNTLEYFNTSSWKKYRVDSFSEETPDISRQIAIQTYPTGKVCRAVTLGMDKFCLPDISVQDFLCKNQKSIFKLVKSLSQSLSENPKIYDDSTLILNISKIKNQAVSARVRSNQKDIKEVVQLKLKAVPPSQGDKQNKQFMLAFDNTKYFSKYEEQTAVINDLFGEEENITYVKRNQELMQASQKAIKRLPWLKDQFVKGLEPGYKILLKAPFKTDSQGLEWIWVEIFAWQGEGIQGTLLDKPYEISSMKAGDTVNVKQGEVMDYIFYKPDGSYEGNETEKVIQSMN